METARIGNDVPNIEMGDGLETARMMGGTAGARPILVLVLAAADGVNGWCWWLGMRLGDGRRH